MGWNTNDNELTKKFTFKDFSACWAFASRVALLAEQQHHHPNMVIKYNELHLSLSTHDAGNTISEKDHRLAEAIDSLT
jgi:4a-hydroxytetrahydrobiopterin dehydratase